MPFFISTTHVIFTVFDGDAAVVGHVSNKSFRADTEFIADLSAHCIRIKRRVTSVTFFGASASTVSPFFVGKSTLLIGTVVVAYIEGCTGAISISDKTMFAKTDSVSLGFVGATWMTVHCCVTSCSSCRCSAEILAAVLFPTSISFIVPLFILAALVVVAVIDRDAAKVGHVSNESFITDTHFFTNFSAHCVGVHVRVAGVTFLFAFAATVGPDFVWIPTLTLNAHNSCTFTIGNAHSSWISDVARFTKADFVIIIC
jgi:hypothetical protein